MLAASLAHSCAVSARQKSAEIVFASQHRVVSARAGSRRLVTCSLKFCFAHSLILIVCLQTSYKGPITVALTSSCPSRSLHVQSFRRTRSHADTANHRTSHSAFARSSASAQNALSNARLWNSTVLRLFSTETKQTNSADGETDANTSASTGSDGKKPTLTAAEKKALAAGEAGV